MYLFLFDELMLELPCNYLELGQVLDRVGRTPCTKHNVLIGQCRGANIRNMLTLIVLGLAGLPVASIAFSLVNVGARI